ncbi:MAG: NAD-dependent epimerase/dehydratase family protein [Syntrophobacteraceae bacterium]
MSRALVTGGAGFIGAHLVRELLRSGIEVVVLDDLSGGFEENIPDKVRFIKGSVTNGDLVNNLFAEFRFDYVYHLAAYAAEGLSHFIRHFNYENNLLGSVNLINAAVNYETRCFVFTSSIAVYGAGQVPMREDMVPQPEDPYGIAKYAIELDLKVAHEMFGLNYVVFRPHNVYGEFQNIGDKYRNVVGIFMNQILTGQPMTIFGDGEQQRAFSYVGDIVGLMARAAWTAGAYQQVFNIGANTPYTVNQLANSVALVMGAPGHPVKHLHPRNEVKIAFSDHGNLSRVLGEPEFTALEDGLNRMAEWVKEVGARTTSIFQAIEIPQNLPPSWRA